MAAAAVEQNDLLLEIEEPTVACAGGCQARMPPLAHANFRLEDHCDEARGDILQFPDARTCRGIAGVVAKNFVFGILTMGPAVAVLLLLAELSRGGDRARLLFGACALDALMVSAIIAFSALWGCASVTYRAEELFLAAPLFLVAGALAVPPVLSAYFQWVPHWDFVNRQCLAWLMCALGATLGKDCLVHGARSALEAASARLPRAQWWRRQSLAAEMCRNGFINLIYVAPFALTVLAASSLRYRLTHEYRRSGIGHYAIIVGFLCAHSGTIKLFSHGVEQAATLDRHTDLIAASEEDRLGPLQTAKLRAVLASAVSFPMALAGKLLVTALQSWQEALAMSCLNTVIEVVETVRALQTARAAMAPARESRCCLEAVQEDLGETTSNSLANGLRLYEERISQERRRMVVIATKILAEQMGEYQLMTGIVAAALIFAGHPVVDGFTNGEWGTLQVLIFVATQFGPELLCDFASLCWVQAYGVEVQSLHNKVHMDSALVGQQSTVVARWMIFATLAAEKRLWGA